jgi:type II secretory pathway pseudopilin PulG
MKSFTLIETLVVITVFALVMGALAGFVLWAYQTQSFAFQQAVAIGEARKGIETMVKEIREARVGDDGSYPIELATDKEFIFYSDIDKDGDTERVRYFLGTAGSGSQTKECQTFSDGGSCSVTFSNFLGGDLTSAEVEVSLDGDFGWSREYAEIYADGNYLDRVCQTGCSDCPGSWEGTQTFDVTSQAQDNSLQLTADATGWVNDLCPHSMKAKFKLSWTENLTGGQSDFRKGVTNPTGSPLQYPQDQEVVTVLSQYVRNAPPIFRYFDASGNELTETPTRLKDTKVMEVYLIVNVNPQKVPQNFELRSAVQLRNLKEE